MVLILGFSILAENAVSYGAADIETRRVEVTSITANDKYVQGFDESDIIGLIVNIPIYIQKEVIFQYLIVVLDS